MSVTDKMIRAGNTAFGSLRIQEHFDYRLAVTYLAMKALDTEVGILREALQPFADCVEQIKPDEDDEEWAKFRLLIKDYRRAAKALANLRTNRGGGQ